MHKLVDWGRFILNYFIYRYHTSNELRDDVAKDVSALQKAYTDFSEKLSRETWVCDEYRREMLLAAEGLCVLAELNQKMLGEPCDRLTDTTKWLADYKEKWLEKNKPSELHRIPDMITYIEEN